MTASHSKTTIKWTTVQCVLRIIFSHRKNTFFCKTFSTITFLQHFLTIRIRRQVHLLAFGDPSNRAARYSRQIFNFSATFVRPGVTFLVVYQLSCTLDILFRSDNPRSFTTDLPFSRVRLVNIAHTFYRADSWLFVWEFFQIMFCTSSFFDKQVQSTVCFLRTWTACLMFIIKRHDDVTQLPLCFLCIWAVFICVAPSAQSCHDLFKLHKDFSEMIKLNSALYTLCLSSQWRMITGSNAAKRRLSWPAL